MRKQPSSSTAKDSEELLDWDNESLSFAASRTVSFDASTLAYDVSSKRASTASFITVKSSSSSIGTVRARTRDPQARRSSLSEILSKSFTFLTALPRISSARNELALLRRSSVPAPLYRQTKLLDDFIDLTRDELPYQMKRSALRLIQYSFGQLVRDIFTAATHEQFVKALKELCSDELPYSVRKDGLSRFNYLVGAGASLDSKNYALEYEDCQTILNMLKTTTQVSLKLAACAYLWLSCMKFKTHVYSPVSEADVKDICIILVDLTQYPLPIDVRRDALDWLWRFESVQSSDLTDDDKHIVGSSILEISGYTEANGLLLYRHADCEKDYLSGLQRLWWFSLLGSWATGLQHERKKLRKVGDDLLSITDVQHAHEIRQQGFEMIALFSNLSDWRDMYDDRTWRMISNQFAEFCLRDTERVNKVETMRRVESLLVKTGTCEPESLTRKELQVSRRTSVVIARCSQLAAANNAVRQYCGPDTSVEAALESLAVFTIPGESLLIQKDQQIILYDRICNYARYDQTRLIAVQAMYALLTIQDWLSGITFAKGPPGARD